MAFRLCKAPPDAPFGAIRLAYGTPADESQLTRVWYPWIRLPNNDIVLHVSSVVFAMQDGLVRGFGDDDTKSLWRRYAIECRARYTSGRLQPIDGSYDWSAWLTQEWTPKTYQLAGMERLYARLKLIRGTVLADDVGLGKTVQTIAVGERLRHECRQATKQPIVVVTTLSTLTQWKDEIERFACSRPRILVVDGHWSQRIERLRGAIEADWVVLSYETVSLLQYANAVRAINPLLVVLDESYKVGNPATKTSKRVAQLCERSRLGTVALNATPIENNIVDVYGQLRCIDPSILGAYKFFLGRYARLNPAGRVVGARNLREFRQRTAAVFVRRTSQDCRAEIPRVIAQVRRCPMSLQQETAYRAAVGQYLSDSATRFSVVAHKLSQIRYAAFAADISDPSSPSSKLDDLELFLDNELRGYRVIVISRFRRVIDFAAARLARRQPYVITGRTHTKDRAEIRRRFASPASNGRILLGTTAIERGMNLQSAGVLYNLDLPWNAARLRQRVGRIARVGQSQPSVLVLNAVATGPFVTVDEWILKIVLGKRQLFSSVFGDDKVDELGDKNVSASALRDFLRTTYKPK